MKEYFKFSETSNGSFQVSVNWDLWLAGHHPRDFHFEGSFRVIPARILGIPYDQYLLWLASYGGRLIGKNIKYGTAVFDRPVKEIENILNERATEIFSKINIGGLNY